MRPGSNPIKVVLSKDAAYAKLAAVYGLNKEWLDRRSQASAVVSKAPVFGFKVADYNDKYAAYAALVDKLAISSVEQNALNARGLTNRNIVDTANFKGIGEGVNLSQFMVNDPVKVDALLAKAQSGATLTPLEQRQAALYQRRLKGLTDRLGIQNGRFQNFTDVQNALQNGDFSITAKEVQTNLTNANKVAPEISRQQTKADYRQGLDRVRTRTNIKPTGHINASYLKNQLDANGQAALEGLLKTNPNMSVSEAMAKLKTQGVVTADMKTSMQMVNNAKQEAIKANQQTSRVKKISAAENGPKPFPKPKPTVPNVTKGVTQGVTQGVAQGVTQGVENATKGVVESTGKGASTFLKEQGSRAMKFLGRHKIGAAVAAAGTLLGAGALYSHGKSVGRREGQRNGMLMGALGGGLAGSALGYGMGAKFSSYGDLKAIGDKLAVHLMDWNSLKAAGRKAESILGSDVGYEDFVAEENTLPEHKQFFNTKHSNFTLIPSRRWNPGIDLDTSTAVPAAAALAGGIGAYALARRLVPDSWKAQAISAALGAGVGGLAGYELSGGKMPWQ